MVRKSSKPGIPKYIFGATKAGETVRKRAGTIKTAKLPTSLDEMPASLVSLKDLHVERMKRAARKQ